MLDTKKLDELKKQFRRIFAMPITRTTLREIQNALIAINQESATTLFQAIIEGDVKKAEKICDDKTKLNEIIEEFSVSVKVAKEVFERGEFINLASSDIITKPDQIAFLNRIRRVDGEELQFITDTKGTINLLNHLLERLSELKKNETGKEALLNSKGELDAAKVILERLYKD